MGSFKKRKYLVPTWLLTYMVGAAAMLAWIETFRDYDWSVDMVEFKLICAWAWPVVTFSLLRRWLLGA